MTPDPISQGLLRTLGELEGGVDALGWDRLPELFYIARLPAEAAAAAVDMPVDHVAAAFEVFSANVPDDIWRMANPPWKVLYALADSLGPYYSKHGTLPPVIPSQLYGIAWACEAWAVRALSDEEAKKLGHAPRGTISSHANRIEIRFLHGVDIAGTYYAITRERGGEVTAEVHEHGQRSQQHVIPQGQAVEALNDLLATCLRYAPEPQLDQQ